jgi:hypothetical protein
MQTRLVPILIALVAGPLQGNGPSTGEMSRREVDLALVLAVDTSLSISAEEHQLQIEGYAAAFHSDAVFQAIAGGRRGAIEVTVVEWAGRALQIQRVEWTLVSDRASASKFADRLLAIPYEPHVGTFIGPAIACGRQLLDRAPFRAARHVIDISGDGISADRAQLAAAREAALAQGITINGLPVCDEADCALVQFYRANVVGGPTGFAVVAVGFERFEDAILQKLQLEIAERAPDERMTRTFHSAPGSLARGADIEAAALSGSHSNSRGRN